MMQALLDLAWQSNLELSLLLLLVLMSRWLLRKSAKVYNAYLLWLALPLAPIASEMATRLLPVLNPASLLPASLFNQIYRTTPHTRGAINGSRGCSAS